MILKIALTGAPGCGKTSVMNALDKEFSENGFKVIFVEETATYLINKGIKSFGDDAIDTVDFQDLIMDFQIAKEDVFVKAAKLLKYDNVLIVFDRGVIDGFAYMDKSDAEVLKSRGTFNSYLELLRRYDLVINLVGRKDFYTTENNSARSESAARAMELGDITLNCWLGHPNLKVVMPEEDINVKINNVINIIKNQIKYNSVKRQEKYLVDLNYTDIEYIKMISKCVSIEQIYLQSRDDEEKRLRKIIDNGEVTYYFSTYVENEFGKKIVVNEEKISEEIYKNMLFFKDDRYEAITKKRYYFVANGKYFHLDVFDDLDLALLEVDVLLNEVVDIPEFIKVLDVVSENLEYHNKNIAMRLVRK